MPGAPSLRRTWLHARCRTSLRWTSLYSAWNHRPGSALAARYSACCRARTASSRRSTPGAGLSTYGTHRPLLVNLRVDEAAALPLTGGCVVHPARPVTMAASDAVPAGHPLPGSTPVIGRHAPASLHSRRAGDGFPCSRRHPHHRAERHERVADEDKAILADTYASINPAAVQRCIQALTSELLTLTTSKAGPKTKAPVAVPSMRASSDESTTQTSRAS